MLPRVTAILGYVTAQMGRVAVGLPLLQQALQAVEARGAPYLPLYPLQLGEACLLADRFDDALGGSRRALKLARERGERGHEAYALRLLGEIGSRRGPLEAKQAEASYQQALALAEELGMRPLVGHCHLGLGALYRRVGRIEQARSEVSAAIELFRSMDMTFWLTRAEAGAASASL